MKIFRNLLLILISAGTFLAGCSKVSHRKTPGGMPYQVFKGSGGDKIQKGNFIKVLLTQKVKDSVYFTTGETPIYIPVSESQPYDISETWTKLKVGDSIVAIQMMDTFIKRNPQGIPPEFKNGDRITTYVKVLAVFTSDSLRMKDEEKMRDEKLVQEIKFVENWIAEKNVKTDKTPSGAFIETITPGTGNTPDTGNYVTVNYTGRTFAGVTFDSNTDTAFKHVEPYSFAVAKGAMIKGFDEAVMMMRKGGKARAYIPSTLAYGPRPNSPLIKPYEHLIFDLELVDVKPAPPEPKPDMRMPKIDMPQPK